MERMIKNDLDAQLAGTKGRTIVKRVARFRTTAAKINYLHKLHLET